MIKTQDSLDYIKSISRKLLYTIIQTYACLWFWFVSSAGRYLNPENYGNEKENYIKYGSQFCMNVFSIVNFWKGYHKIKPNALVRINISIKGFSALNSQKL
ncbi:hypothetical protein F4703DRAFT_1917113 [Phycomyces blakesleeanus]